MLSNQEFIDKLDHYYDLIFGFAMKLCGNRADAEDLYQETVVKAYSNLHRYQRGTHFKAWVTTIMRNSFINEYRKRRTRNKVTTTMEGNFSVVDNIKSTDSPSETLFGKELNQVIRELPIGQRKPFMMHFEGYQYQEIADEMNLPVGTIKSRIHFARKQLRLTIKAKFGITKAA